MLTSKSYGLGVFPNQNEKEFENVWTKLYMIVQTKEFQIHVILKLSFVILHKNIHSSVEL